MPKLGTIEYPAKPPKYWMDAKQRRGVLAPGAGRIWYSIYSDTKRLAAWLAAPEAEWKAHGLNKP